MDANALTPQGFWYDTLDSTQEQAKRLLAEGRIQGLAFIVADEQQQGKGSQGRIWQSPKHHGLYLSVVQQSVNPTEGFTLTPAYTLAAAVACVEAVHLVTQIALKLKPINDLMGATETGSWAKCGGILVESQVTQNRLTSLITGIGINLSEAPQGLDQPTISLSQCRTDTGALPSFCHIPPGGRDTMKDNLIDTLVGKIAFWHGLIQQQHPNHGKSGQLLRTWQRHALAPLPESCLALLDA